jgi:small conductance mechanosensitive channel
MPPRLVPSAAFVASLLLLCPAVEAQTQPEEVQTEEVQPEVPEAERLLEEIERLRSGYHALEKEERKLKGEERLVVALQMRKQLFEFMRQVDKLVTLVVRQREEGVRRPTGMKRTRTLLLEMDRRIPQFIDSLEAAAAEVRKAISEAPEESRKQLESRLRTIEEVLDEVYPFFLDHLRHRESLGLEAGNGRKQLESRLTGRTSRLSGRVELLSQRRAEARKEAEESPGDAALQAALRVADEELDGAASSLWTTCDVMDELGLATAEYRTVLIRSTGEITGDVLDVDVVIGLLDQAVDAVIRWLDRRGPSILARLALFVAILALFWMLGGLARRFVSRLADRAENVSELSRRILVGVASRSVIALGFFVALSQVGVNVTALLAGLGIAGFIVGFALQDTLGNFASGAMILMYRPFDVGDVIEAGGVYGTVHGMSLVSTTILTFDNQTLVVPNSKIWGDVIRNVTAQDIRRVDLEFGLSHSVDVARAEEVLASILREHPKVLEDPEPLVKVHKLTDSTTQFVVRPWVKREDYWQVYWELTREAKLRLDREKIPLGIPRHEVQLHGESSD